MKNGDFPEICKRYQGYKLCSLIIHQRYHTMWMVAKSSSCAGNIPGEEHYNTDDWEHFMCKGETHVLPSNDTWIRLASFFLWTRIVCSHGPCSTILIWRNLMVSLLPLQSEGFLNRFSSVQACMLYALTIVSDHLYMCMKCVMTGWWFGTLFLFFQKQVGISFHPNSRTLFFSEGPGVGMPATSCAVRTYFNWFDLSWVCLKATVLLLLMFLVNRGTNTSNEFGSCPDHRVVYLPSLYLSHMFNPNMWQCTYLNVPLSFVSKLHVYTYMYINIYIYVYIYIMYINLV